MTVPGILLLAYLLVSLLYWLYTAYAVVRMRTSVRALKGVQPVEPQTWPKLSVVVPACDEADKLEPAARTLLDEDYPNLELVFVDDRSTDGTGQIMDRLAAEDDRVKVIHVAELPEDWLGKVHALDRGVAASTGEFVLFTDADVHFQVGTFRKAVAWCLEKDLDFLTGLPSLWPTGLVLDAMISVFFRHLMLATRPWGMRHGPLRSCLGVGAFNLVRRSAFDKTEGFEWLRMETADDYALGYMMKRSGATCGVIAVFRSVGLHWYRTIREAAVGAEKGFSSALRCSLPLALTAPLAMLAVEMSPLVSLLVLVLGGFGAAWGIAAANVLLFFFATVPPARWARVRILPPLLSPLVAPILAVLTMRVGIVGRRRGGVMWRGTLYSSEKLRKGRRIPIP